MAKLISFLLLGLLLFSCSETGYQITGNISEQTVSTQSGKLEEILLEKDIKAEYILFIASDGTAFFISEKSIPEINIIRQKDKYNTETSSLPPVCNLNDITEICISNSDFPLENYQTPFSIRMNDFELLGESSKDGYFVRKYKLKEGK